jgi:hypothetical protein
MGEHAGVLVQLDDGPVAAALVEGILRDVSLEIPPTVNMVLSTK